MDDTKSERSHDRLGNRRGLWRRAGIDPAEVLRLAREQLWQDPMAADAADRMGTDRSAPTRERTTERNGHRAGLTAAPMAHGILTTLPVSADAVAALWGAVWAWEAHPAANVAVHTLGRRWWTADGRGTVDAPGTMARLDHPDDRPDAVRCLPPVQQRGLRGLWTLFLLTVGYGC